MCNTLFCTFLSEFAVEFAPLQRGTSRNFLVTRFMEEMSYVLLFSFLFFNGTHFQLGGRKHFSFSHRRYEIFMFFFKRNWSTLFFISRSSSFSVIHVNVDIKI